MNMEDPNLNRLFSQLISHLTSAFPTSVDEPIWIGCSNTLHVANIFAVRCHDQCGRFDTCIENFQCKICGHTCQQYNGHTKSKSHQREELQLNYTMTLISITGWLEICTGQLTKNAASSFSCRVATVHSFSQLLCRLNMCKCHNP